MYSHVLLCISYYHLYYHVLPCRHVLPCAAMYRHVLPCSAMCYHVSPCITIYKITKIVCALWLAERSVCMRVCKHGFDVRCSAFRALISEARIWKSFSDQNSTSLLYLPIPMSAETWKVFINKLCQLFFRLSWHLKRENPYLGKYLFAKQELIPRARLCVQNFATDKNFSFNQCHNKEFCFFSRESYFIKAIENFFPVFA